jgi:hypothetical protein
MGPGPEYRSLMTFGQADDLVYEFATNRIATPGSPTQHTGEVCVSRSLISSLRVGQCVRNVSFRISSGNNSPYRKLEDKLHGMGFNNI